MVPRRRAQPRLEPLALPLPAGRVPVRGPAPGERPPRQARSGVRAARHRSVRRRPVLDRRGALRQGRPGRPADVGPGHQRRSGPGHPARAADRLVPQHLVVGGRQPAARAGGDRGRRRSRCTHPFLGELELLAAPGPDGAAPTALFCENETNTERLYGVTGDHAVPEGRDQRPRRDRRGHRQPRPARDQVRVLVPADGRAGRDRRAAAAAAAGGLRVEPATALGPDFDERASPGAGPRPTSSTPS